MNSYEFYIEEVKRDGYIAWDAVETKSNVRFPVNATEPYAVGTFPEISKHLQEKGIDFRVAYAESFQDSFNGKSWRYVRDDTEVIVHDTPRTIYRITFGGSP